MERISCCYWGKAEALLISSRFFRIELFFKKSTHKKGAILTRPLFGEFEEELGIGSGDMVYLLLVRVSLIDLLDEILMVVVYLLIP